MEKTPCKMIIREVKVEDAAAICRIYNHYVENTAITFETLPVSMEEMENRIRKIVGEGHPYYVAETDGKIVGFAYLHFWHTRAAYSGTKEITIYLDHQQKGKRYGKDLYKYLLERIDCTKTHVLIAVITIPNDASVKLHEKFGFCQVSHLKEVGYKFGQWVDVGHWQLIL